MKNIIYISICSFLLFVSCQPEKQSTNLTYQVKSFRYSHGNMIDAAKTEFLLLINNQGDSLVKYQYFIADSSQNPQRVMMDIEVIRDSLLLMKVGDYRPNIQRVLYEKKTFYMGRQQVEICKFKRVEVPENKNDVIFITKGYGVVNMLSYDTKTKILYSIVSDKTAESIFTEINNFLEKDTTGFYYQSER